MHICIVYSLRFVHKYAYYSLLILLSFYDKIYKTTTLNGEIYIMIALSASEVTLSFGTDVILKDVSFSVNDGDRVGIIGVNGAGKTSLFKIITEKYRADSGAIYIQKGHTVGMLEQNPNLSALPGDISCLVLSAIPPAVLPKQRFPIWLK